MSREYPCVYYDNEKCQKFTDDHFTSWCLKGPCKDQVLSNADRIRAMSDDELATTIHAIRLGWTATWCDYHCENEGDDGCDKCVLAWLKQPTEADT